MTAAFAINMLATASTVKQATDAAENSGYFVEFGATPTAARRGPAYCTIDISVVVTMSNWRVAKSIELLVAKNGTTMGTMGV